MLESSPRRLGEVCSSGASDKIGSEAGPDLLGNQFGRAGLGIAQAARAGETLLLAGNIIGDPRRGRTRDDGLAGNNLGYRVMRIQTEAVELVALGDRIDDDRIPGRDKTNGQS